ncbi:MAG: hypothetical protein Q4G30_07930 [Actinomycetaceae bacterium]|nr:hypothetical protein [Actinomycetaceae bacterium]
MATDRDKAGPLAALSELGEDEDCDNAGVVDSQILVFTPQDKLATQEVPQTQAKLPLRALARVAAVIAVAALVFFIYKAGLPGEEDGGHASMTTTGELPEGHPPTDSASAPALMGRADPEAEKQRIAELEEILKQQPDDVNALLELGVLVFDQGNVSVAQSYWERAKTLDPNRVQVWFNLGFLYMSSDPPDTQAAHDAWAKVLELEPNSQLATVVRNHMKALEAMHTEGGTSLLAPTEGVGQQ